MNKARGFSKAIKLIALLFLYTARLMLKVIVRLSKELITGVNKRLRFSITFKTAAIYTLIFSVILSVFSAILISSFGFFLLHQSGRSLEKSAEVIIHYMTVSRGVPETEIAKFAAIEGIKVTIFNKEKEVVHSTESDQNSVEQEVGLAPGVSVSTEDVNYNTRAELHNQTYYLQLSRPLLEEKSYLIILLAAVIVCFIVAVLLTVTIGSRTLRKMLRPIDNMITTTKTISARQLDTRLNVVDSHDELKDLAETFNEMLDRIQASYEQQNQFVSDASHELRTPIAVIQGYANLLRRWGMEEKEVLEESVAAIKNEADNMKDLVEKLLFLARADKNTQKLQKSCFSMNELVDEVVKETKMIDNEHNLINELNENFTVDGDRGLIKQALRIFMDNSMRYTPSGGTIKISSFLKSNRVMLIVEDSGTGIAEADLPHIFNRFYKCDRSRTREGGGTGLGLSIAKWIIEKHNGTIGAESALGKGTKMIMTLPLH